MEGAPGPWLAGLGILSFSKVYAFVSVRRSLTLVGGRIPQTPGSVSQTDSVRPGETTGGTVTIFPTISSYIVHRTIDLDTIRYMNLHSYTPSYPGGPNTC